MKTNFEKETKDEKLTNFQRVKQFHRAFDHIDPDVLTQPSSERKKLRLDLILEEVKETAVELGFDLKIDITRRHSTYKDSKGIFIPVLVDNDEIDMAKTAKELADILYVVYGAAANFGIDLDKVFAEVHRSNMTKLGPDGKPVYREDGKILKGPNYEVANIEKVLGLI